MEVTSISISQQNFRGTTHKSVKKYVKRAVSNECHNRVNEANKSGSVIVQEELVVVREQGERIINMLSDFFGQCHPNTQISLETPFWGKNQFVISNKRLPNKAKVPVSDVARDLCNCQDVYVALPDSYKLSGDNLYEKISSYELNVLERFVNMLRKTTTPQKVDEYLLQKAKKLAEQMARSKCCFHEVRALNTAYKADRFAKSIDREANTVAKTADLIDELASNEKIAEENHRKIVNVNKEILNEVIKK